MGRRRAALVSLKDAAVYRLDHWAERWDCVAWCTATGPCQRHEAACRSMNRADHPTVGLLQTGWGL